MQEVTKWKANDGQEFDCAIKCADHEARRLFDGWYAGDTRLSPKILMSRTAKATDRDVKVPVMSDVLFRWLSTHAEKLKQLVPNLGEKK